MRRSIKVLGMGCAKCKETIRVVEGVVRENHIDATISKVDDITEIVNYEVFATPALVIDEEVKLKGRVPTKDEILALLNYN